MSLPLNFALRSRRLLQNMHCAIVAVNGNDIATFDSLRAVACPKHSWYSVLPCYDAPMGEDRAHVRDKACRVGKQLRTALVRANHSINTSALKT